MIGSLMVAESPRWLLRRGKKDAAYAALLRSRTTEQADLELREMQEVSRRENEICFRHKKRESLLRRKYVIPFILACIILACNQATGINSIIAYNANILLQSGLSDFAAHWGYFIFQCVNFSVTCSAWCWWTARAANFFWRWALAASSSRSPARRSVSWQREAAR